MGTVQKVNYACPVTITPGLCHRCGACVAVCPHDALFLWNGRLVVNEACSACGRCVTVCPVRALALAARSEA